MKILPLIVAAGMGFALAGCSNQYYQRQDKVTFGAGDAVSWNDAQQIADPAPRRAYNTNIPIDGERAAHAVRNYELGPAPRASSGAVGASAGSSGSSGGSATGMSPQ